MAKVDVGNVIAGKYKVLSLLGTGGMGAVFKVRDLDGNELALKICTAHEDVAKKRFAREVRIMASIRHPNVVSVLDFDGDHDPPYFVMPLARNTLEQEVPSFATDENAAIQAFLEMCNGIQAIHNSAAVHRDIKPLNALRMQDGQIVVSDLGLARFDDRDTTTLTQTGAFLGTRLYCAPEQLLPDGSRDADARTDVYQLGKTLYHLLTGQLPALIDASRVHRGLLHILQRATKENPRDRYDSVAKLIDAIETYRASKDPARNPRQTIENLLQQARQLLQQRQFNGENVVAILNAMTNAGLSNETTMEMFEQFPEELFPIAASLFPNELSGAVRIYREAVNAVIGGASFSHAEIVARKMQMIFNGTKDMDLRVLCIETTLIAAVHLHRFAAMSVFNDMLQAVATDEAIPVAEMLNDRFAFYAVVAKQIPPDRLQTPIRNVQQAALNQALG